MFSNGINYNTNSIAQNLVYSAYKLDLPQNNLSKNNTEDTINISPIKTRGTDKSSYANNVYFREGLKGEYVNVGLSDENLQRLQETFGSQSVKKDSNGNVILKGEAENFVSSWFNDIAYKRGYVQADSNNDGSLSLDEKYNTTTFFGSGAVQTGNNVSAYNYMNYAKVTDFANANDSAGVNAAVSNSIEEELNKTLENDKDMDGKIYFGDTASSKKILSYFRDIMGNNNTGGGHSLFDDIPTIDDFLKPLKEMVEQMKKMMKEELEKNNQASNQIQNQTQSSIPENSTDENSTLKELMELTKLDKETLVHNLKNNPNFEDNIISIVNELTQNVDSRYASNNTSARKSLDIYA